MGTVLSASGDNIRIRLETGEEIQIVSSRGASIGQTVLLKPVFAYNAKQKSGLSPSNDDIDALPHPSLSQSPIDRLKKERGEEKPQPPNHGTPEGIGDKEPKPVDHPISSERSLRNKPFITMIAGISYNKRQDVCKNLFEGAHLLLVREHDNNYDANAVAVYFNGQELGYIPKDFAPTVANALDKSQKVSAIVSEIKGGGEYLYGVKIKVQIENVFNIENNENKRGYELTQEQKDILNYKISNDEILKIIAFAGTGKTTTLFEYSKRYPLMRFLYIAFNKSVQINAEKKFPSNVICRTSHSLAFQKYGKEYKHKLTGNLKFNVIKSILNLEKYEDVKLVYDTFMNFIISSDYNISEIHLSWKPQLLTDKDNFYISNAYLLWKKMIDPNDLEIEMIHDGYLKLYQLSNPIMNFDCILLDEAQDTNPVVTHIVLSQKCSKILVGDPHQQIYGFRGASDAMNKIRASKTFYLTNCFRFGEEIAWIANKILKRFKLEDKILKGVRKKNSTDADKSFGVIARTNAGVFDQAAYYCNFEKIAFVGGIEGYQFDDILDIYYLYSNTKTLIKNPYIKTFSKYNELKKLSEEVDDWELKSKCKIIEKYENAIPDIIKKIKNSVVDFNTSNVILTTAHKSKGSEFSKIKLCCDFPELFREGELISRGVIADEEFNLMYVAVTRAKDFIEFSNEFEWKNFISNGEENGYQEVLSFLSHIKVRDIIKNYV